MVCENDLRTFTRFLLQARLVVECVVQHQQRTVVKLLHPRYTAASCCEKKKRILYDSSFVHSCPKNYLTKETLKYSPEIPKPQSKRTRREFFICHTKQEKCLQKKRLSSAVLSELGNPAIPLKKEPKKQANLHSKAEEET
jgi:hypothetical protein